MKRTADTPTASEPQWPEPVAHRIMAFGRMQHLVVRADVASEIADKQQSSAAEAGIDSKPYVEELFTADQVRAILATHASAPPEEPSNRAFAIALLSEAAKSGHPGTMKLAAQLAGVPACDACGYVVQHCRCATPAAAEPLSALSHELLKELIERQITEFAVNFGEADFYTGDATAVIAKARAALHAAPARNGGEPSTPSSHWRAEGEPDPHDARYYDQERATLCMGNLTDDELANLAFMNYDRHLSVAEMVAGKPTPLVWMTAVKDRIRWLSRALEKALASSLEAKQAAREVSEPLTDADGAPYTAERLARWLDAKYSRHHEEEDKAAADMLRRLASAHPAAPPEPQAWTTQAHIHAMTHGKAGYFSKTPDTTWCVPVFFGPARSIDDHRD